jgi:hypothetical protein
MPKTQWVSYTTLIEKAVTTKVNAQAIFVKNRQRISPLRLTSYLDPELIRKYENKQAWSKKKDKSNEKALEALRDLLGVINLKSQNLEGVCHGCINMAGRKDQLAMAKELKKFEKIDWVRERLRR